MRYPIAIEPGDSKQAYGVVVPDLPGCFSAGDTLDEAFENAKEAIEGWVEYALDHEQEVPQPSTIEAVQKNSDFKGWIFGAVDVDLSKLSGKAERIDITLSRYVLRRLDAKAKLAGDTRSGYIAHMVMAN